MKKHIAEDLPARKHPQAQMSVQSKNSEKPERGSDKDNKGGEKTPEQRIRQAVYDIRYRARRENIPLRTAYSQYMQNSSMSESEKTEVRAKLFGKEGMQAEDFEIDMKVSASNSMARALYTVFVEKKEEVIDENKLKKQLEEASQNSEDRKYKVRVHDPDSGVTYVRYATRKKINELRAKGLDVEMTEYGTPYEGERTKGEKTSEVLGKKAKKDYDGDGKVESGAKEYRGVIHNKIQQRKGGKPDGKDTSSVKENFIHEVSGMANLPQMDSSAYVDSNINNQPVDVLPNNKKNKVTVNPTDSSNTKLVAHNELEGQLIAETGYSKFLMMLQEKKMTAAKKKKEKTLKAKYDPSGMKASMKKQYGEKKGEQVYFATIRKQAMKEESDCKSKDSQDDKRSIPTKVSLIKSKFQSMGVKNPLVIASDYKPEGQELDEGLPALAAGAAALGAGAYGLSQLMKSKRSKVTGSAKPSTSGSLSDRATERNQRIKDLMNQSYEPEGEIIDEARAEEKRGYESTGSQRQKQRKGLTTTSYSGGQNTHLRGKEYLNKTQRRARSRRYLDQPGGVNAAPENEQGKRRYAKMQAQKRDQSHMHSPRD